MSHIPQAAKSFALFLELQHQVHTASSLQALRYVIVNETNHLFPYRQAILWEPNEKISAVSGLAIVDQRTPFALWVNVLCKYFFNNYHEKIPLELTMHNVPEILQEDWAEWLPHSVLWIPLFVNQECIGSLLLCGNEPYEKPQQKLLFYLCETYAQALYNQRRMKKDIFSWEVFLTQSKVIRIAVLLLILVLCFPVSYTALAPAQIVAKNPYIIRSPLDGVVEKVLIEPNEKVSHNQALLYLDTTTLQSRLEVAIKRFEITQTEYRQISQMALFDAKSKTQVATLKAEMEQAQTEVDYIKTMLNKATLKATQEGIILMEDPNEWEGRPVQTGERILSIADIKHTELEIWVGVNDAIALKKGANVKFFRNSTPHKPLDAQLSFLSYEPQVDPSGVLAYRMLAQWDSLEDAPILGLKGSAKVYGDKTVLGLYLLRRPMAVIRQWIGW